MPLKYDPQEIPVQCAECDAYLDYKTPLDCAMCDRCDKCGCKCEDPPRTAEEKAAEDEEFDRTFHPERVEEVIEVSLPQSENSLFPWYAVFSTGFLINNPNEGWEKYKK